MQVTALGTGSPEPSATRASSGYLVDAEGTSVLLDCGGGVVGRLIEAGRLPQSVDWVVFSHLHSDHMIDHARLIHAAWDAGRVPRVAGPAPIAEITRRLFGPEGALAFDLTARTENAGSREVWAARGGTLPRPWPAPEVTELAPGDGLPLGPLRLTTCAVPHAQPELTCLALRLDGPGASVVYAGDSGPSADLERLAASTDLLIHWCYRRSAETADAYVARMSPTAGATAAMAARAGARRLWLTHLRPHMDTADIRAELLAEARAALPRTEIAHDLLTVALP